MFEKSIGSGRVVNAQVQRKIENLDYKNVRTNENKKSDYHNSTSVIMFYSRVRRLTLCSLFSFFLDYNLGGKVFVLA
jgi:hypothetical protein